MAASGERSDSTVSVRHFSETLQLMLKVFRAQRVGDAQECEREEG